MYLARTITLGVEALKATFPGPIPDLQIPQLAILTEYPMEKISIPGIWMNFVPSGPIQPVSIGQAIYIEDPDDADKVVPVYRWKFTGSYEMTVATLGNLERAKVMDYLALAIGLGGQDAPDTAFRQAIEEDSLVAINTRMGSFTIGGFAETPGTPWGTDDVVYEATLSLDLEGEYVFVPTGNSLIPLTSVIIHEPSIDPDPPQPGGSGWV